MADHQSATPYYGRRVYRIVWGAFGLFLTALGLCVFLFGVVDPLIRIGAGLLIVVLGANAVWCALQSKVSWLAKLSPII